jgi:bacteriocin-like protein
MKKKLTLSKETLRTLDEKELSQIVGGALAGQSGSNRPPAVSCPNSKTPNTTSCKG